MCKADLLCRFCGTKLGTKNRGLALRPKKGGPRLKIIEKLAKIKSLKRRRILARGNRVCFPCLEIANELLVSNKWGRSACLP